MDMISLVLAKPLDKHGITLVHVTYLPLNLLMTFVPQSLEEQKIYKSLAAEKKRTASAKSWILGDSFET